MGLGRLRLFRRPGKVKCTPPQGGMHPTLRQMHPTLVADAPHLHPGKGQMHPTLGHSIKPAHYSHRRSLQKKRSFFVKRATACSGSGHRFESYIVHQNKKSTQQGGLFVLVWHSDVGLEPIAVQTLVTTFIFAPMGQKCKSSPISSTTKKVTFVYRPR